MTKKIKHVKKHPKKVPKRARKFGTNVPPGELIDSLAKKYSLGLDEKQIKQAEAGLRKELKLSEVEDFDTEELWNQIEKSETRLAVTKAADLTIKALETVWRVFNYHARTVESLKAAIPELARRAGMKKVTRLFDPLIATYRAVIDCGDNRRIGSGGAQAIQWLKHNGQLPETIVAFQAEHGGGQDSWSRAWQAHNRKLREANGENTKPKLKTAAAALASLRKKLRDGDGAVLFLRKVGTVLEAPSRRTIASVQDQHWDLVKKALRGLKSVKLKTKKKWTKKPKSATPPKGTIGKPMEKPEEEWD